ncbi:MAG: malate synthase A [Myxococcota bacterium]|jgi:malate synthase|nr:malate synthase A [Myxococcota bacterium]
MFSRSKRLQVLGALEGPRRQLFSQEALDFVEAIVERFEPRRRELLDARKAYAQELAAGALPHFLPETSAIREGDWRVAPIPADLADRRVEITGPVDRKMIINALNSGAQVFMADFEDSNAPSWDNIADGQVNLRDAVRRSISFISPEGKQYQLAERTAVLFVRPRGLHLPEKHVLFDGEAVGGGLLDFAIYFFHNASTLLANGSGPYFYLPKLQSYLEARLWNEVFVFAQNQLSIPQGSIRATVLIETLLAAFQMDEILFELKDHSAGLNCGRWDYIFSIIKTFAGRRSFTLPNRAEVTMETHCMRSYSRLLIDTCHRRKVHAMGGMAAQIPIKRDPEANQRALDKVRADKLREVLDGHDGTWVAHPGLVPIAREIFDAKMPGANQIERIPGYGITGDDLLKVPSGSITEAGVRHNIDVSIQYMEAWLRGNGCVPIYDLMEDAATAEISRSQLWQWLHHEASLDDGRKIDEALMSDWLEQGLEKLKAAVGEASFEAGKYREAAALVRRIVFAETYTEFLTLAAYDAL